MITVDQQTSTTLVAFIGVTIAMFAYLASIKRDLKSEFASTRAELKGEIADARAESASGITGLRVELKNDIAETRAELKAEIGKVEARLISLEDRTYDISTRLPAVPASSSTS